MGDFPTVSVIIPVYNGEQFIREALESVARQTHRPLEVFVADDGSTDASREVARSFQDVTILELPHRGVSHARNEAVRRSRGAWLAFLDVDDRWMPRKLEAQLSAAISQPELGIIFTHQVFDVSDPAPAWYRGPDHGTVRTGFEPSSWLVRRDVFDLVGDFDPSRRLAEDTEWLARLHDERIPMHVVPEILVQRTIHGANASGSIPNQKQIIVGILRQSVQRKQRQALPEE